MTLFRFLGSTVGDELSLATKERGAILLGGRLGKTYFINDDTGEMTTSSYCMRELPVWTLAWNKKKLADSYFGKKWERLLPPEAYAVSVPDDAKAEADSKGLGKVFPHVVNGKLSAPGADFYEAFTHTPFANDDELDFAKAAVDGEKLGGRGVTDLLAISLSAIDLAGRFRLDRLIGQQHHLERTAKRTRTRLRWRWRRKVQPEMATHDCHRGKPLPMG